MKGQASLRNTKRQPVFKQGGLSLSFWSVVEFSHLPHTMKKFLAGTIFGIILSSSSIAMASYGNVFNDIAADTWYTSAANDLYTRGVLTGYSDGTLKPNSNINRAETAVMMDRLLEDIDRNYEPFPVDDNFETSTSYYVCQATDGQVDIADQERIYEESGDFVVRFYDNTGTFIGERNEDSQEPVVQVENCLPTTKTYFDSKVN